MSRSALRSTARFLIVVVTVGCLSVAGLGAARAVPPADPLEGQVSATDPYEPDTLAPEPEAGVAAVAPPTPAGLPAGLEQLAAYVPQNSCSLTAQPGTVRLAALLRASYPSIAAGTTRVCSLATSEHHDGRAIDWMSSVRVRQERAAATEVIRWMLAADRAGNPHANARRLGVMYLIWNNRIWSAYRAAEGWRPYRNCANTPARSLDSVCHRNHIHISLSWHGARAQTSYWTKRVSGPDYGPCRPRDLNWSRYYTKARPRACPDYPEVVPPRGASATLRALVPYSGIDLRRGSRGDGVKALQRALGITRDGIFGRETEAAVKEFQRDHDITASGRVGYTVWRALLADNAPESAARRTAPEHLHPEHGATPLVEGC